MIYISCTLVLCVHAHSEEGVEFPRIGVTDGCELWCRHWELNLGPMKEQQVLLTAKPSVKTQAKLFMGTVLPYQGLAQKSVHWFAHKICWAACLESQRGMW